MADLLTAIGLIFVVEGLVYAAFPVGMKRMIVSILGMPASTLRAAGLISAMFGLAVVWLVRG
ncbi:DUF2065 domain-containing protein [Fodinicurvata sp. EGI_FJ10296]|uniref:DUF2065 domain-containing protein n=1 Tax=Fodinicurvata sp. EGI_FJ10296 TaxID=3231908 RepID=UPI0034563CFD